jgi:hypothetical protein
MHTHAHTHNQDDDIALLMIRMVKYKADLKVILKNQFLINFDVPADRVLTASERCKLTSLTILDVPGADVFARAKSGKLLSPADQLQAFRGRTGRKPKNDQLELYLKSRGLLVSGANKDDMFNSVVESMEHENELKCFNIVDPADGAYEKRRVLLLHQLGVITSTNAPGLVPPPKPPLDDEGWCFVKRDALDGLSMLHVLYDWVDMLYETYAETSAHIRKASRKANGRRAYYCRVLYKDEFMYLACRVDRSRIRETKEVVLVFKMPVGRDLDQQVPTLIAGCCEIFTAGSHHGGCSHILAALNMLVLLQQGTIVAGEVGDGDKRWGDLKKSSVIAVQPIEKIAILTSNGRMTTFTGFSHDAPPRSCRIQNYIDRYQKLEEKDSAASIIELHRFVDNVKTQW